MIFCALTLSNASLIEEASKCYFVLIKINTFNQDSGHWQVPHSGMSSAESKKSAINEYVQWVSE